MFGAPTMKPRCLDTVTETLHRLLAVAAAVLLLVSACCVRDRNPNGPDTEYHVSIAAEAHGSVAAAPSDTIVLSGTNVTATAVPETGYLFVGWFGSLQSTDNPFTFPVDGDVALTARFAHTGAGGGVLIAAKGRTFVMGSESSQAQPDEKPARRVSLTHDYYLDRCEVTQREFLLLMGDNPSASSASGDVGDSFPVFNVTWYRAALYCNARSKAEGYDTVYSYTAVCGATQQCPYVLADLAIHYDRFGYRLPTEAEWEYACRGGTTSEFPWNGDSTGLLSDTFAWYSGNTLKTEPVGMKKPNGYGLYDMCGNVGEWVDDWKTAYAASDSVDPVGPRGRSPEVYESQYGRPVRGGSWRLGTSFLRASSRCGPYAVSARVYQNDIGFRTVLGVFFPPPSSDTSPVTPPPHSLSFTCQKSDIVNFIGTYRVKLAFTLGLVARELYYVDFSEDGLRVHRLVDSVPAYAPHISPSGGMVAYSTNMVGFSGTSTARIHCFGQDSAAPAVLPANPAFIPRWWVDPASRDTFLIYTDGASPDDQPQWRLEKTYRQRMSGSMASGAPEVLWDRGSYHGGLSSNGRFVGTSFTVSRLIDLQIGDTNIFYFYPPANGRTDLPQTCNLSMSPSLANPGEAILLDFGYNQVSTLVGKPYGLHGFIFRCAMQFYTDKHVTGWYEKPRDYAEWDDVEYSNHPDFAAAVALPSATTNPSGIFLVNLRDSSYLQVATAPEVFDPFLWINPADVSEAPDPYRLFARYDLPIQEAGQVYMVEKMRLFWKYRSAIDCAFLGSSPTYDGIDPHYMPHVQALNMGWPMSDLYTSSMVALNYVLPLASGLRAIAIGLEPGTLRMDITTVRPRMVGLYDSEGYGLDSTNGFWHGGVPAAVQGKISAFGSSDWPDADTAGFHEVLASNGWNPPRIDRGDFSFTDPIVQYNLAAFHSLADSAAARNVHVLAVNFPESPAYRDTNVIGRLGPSRTTYQLIVQWLRDLEASNTYFHFYDANNDGNHDYTDAEALDCNHLNSLGARKLSARVDSLLAIYLGR
jgi:uncharacterized repeat protein (TIGR02543 family)